MREWRAVFVILAALALLGASATFAQEGQVKKEEPAAAPAGGTAAPAPAGEGAVPSLTKPDVDGWLDGMMPYALSIGDIAGAVITVVKDSQILTERGFGLADVKSRRPVDPERTLFRPGSVSKLFTWTAVMQLYEQGKIDLDADVNTYLKNFKIPATYPQPITMKHLLSHTPGFEDLSMGIIALTVKDISPLGKFLATHMPARVRPPGEVTS